MKLWKGLLKQHVDGSGKDEDTVVFSKRRVFRVVGMGLLLTTVGLLFLLSHCQQAGIIRQGFLCCAQGVDTDGQEGGVQRIRYKHTQRHFPSCLIIGVRKGGTRALLEFLNIHPSIQAQRKEMHFFDDEETYNFGLEWYRKKMPYSFPDQIVIEKTPAYFVSEDAPKRIQHMNQTVKLILIVRDPTERAISDYTQIHSNKLEKGRYHQSFEELVLDPDTGEVRRSYNAVRRSIYHRHMENWLQFFPLKNFHFVIAENLVRDPVVELRKVETFLGIEHKLTKDLFYYNSTRGFYCVRQDTGEKCLASSKGRQHPSINPLIIAKLHQFFRPHNQKFYDMVGIDFGWP